MRATLLASMAALCACGDNNGPAPGILLACQIQFPQGMDCLHEQPFSPPSDCEWEHSCGHWTYCTCVDDRYDCSVSTVREGDACEEGESCHPTCEDSEDRDRTCSCVDGAWQCAEGSCPDGCPHVTPESETACGLAAGTTCQYQNASCTCGADGLWLCAV